MPLSPTAPVPNPLSSNDCLPTDATLRAWQRHVDAGRIGAGAGQSDALRVQHFRNELVLCGRRVVPVW